jgi:hypothetical protein
LTPLATLGLLRLRPSFLSIFRVDLLSLFEKMFKRELSFIGIQHLEVILRILRTDLLAWLNILCLELKGVKRGTT